MLRPNLIYDIGAHQGDDTAYYLNNGFNVVAVEANPFLARELSDRFQKEIDNGKLIVVNAAIAQNAGEKIHFYVSRDHWRSSAIKNMAERKGEITHTIDMVTETLPSLFDVYGCPFYCKIDIEGYDLLAINGLLKHNERPSYISCELSSDSIASVNQNKDLLFPMIDALRAAGYSKFQLIDQDSLIQLGNKNHYRDLHKLPVRIMTRLERITGWYSTKYNNRLHIARKTNTSSGFPTSPYGEELKGEWDDYVTTKQRILYHFQNYFESEKNKELTFWVDIHAKF